MTAIAGSVFFSLGSIEKLNAAERSVYTDEIGVLELISKDVGLEQAEVFRHAAAVSLQEMDDHEQAIARLEAGNEIRFVAYRKNIGNKAEEQLYAQAVKARKAYSDRTRELLALNRARQKAEANAFAVATEVPAYDLYQSSLDALLRFEEAEQRRIAADTTYRIQQARLVSDSLIGLAVIIALGTGVAVWGIIRGLKQDKRKLQTEVIEHARAELALTRLAAIIESSGDAIVGKDLDGIITSWNRGAEKIFGYTANEMIGTPIMRLIPADRENEEREILTKIKRGENIGHFETVRVTKDGRRIDVAITASPIKDATGKAVGVSKVARDVTERRQSQEALAESDQKFNQLVNNITDVFWIASPDFKTLHYVSAGYELIWGRPKESLYANPHQWIENIVEDDRAHAYEAFGGLRGNDSHVSIEYRIARPDGTIRWIHDRGFQIRDATGALVRLTGVASDITERKLSSEVLAESERRFRELLENVELIAMTLDRDGAVTFCNDYLLELTGWERSEVIGTDWCARFLPDSATAARTMFFENIEAGKIAAHYENPIKTKSGELREIVWNNTILRDAAGKVVGTASIGEDVTERKQADQKLAEQADLLNLAQDAIMVRDMDDRVEFWNHGAESLYGWTAEEVRGRLTADFLHQEEPAAFLAANRTMFETGAWSGECRHLTRKGNAVTVRSRWTLVRDEHGNPKSKLVINTDITEQKKIEEQFLCAQRLESIGTLASGVAHDLNNILVPIMMAAPVLRGEMEPADREKFLDIVETSAQRGAGIIKQVLTFARGTDGDRILLQPIYLLEEVATIARQTFPKSIAVRVVYEQDIRSLEGDTTQLHQVLLNLCINARDAMPDGGELRLCVENFDLDEDSAMIIPGATAGPHVMLQVTDNGTGIPQEVIAKIYEPFFTIKEVGRGTGLGLSTVAGIVKSHGGFIQVSSRPGHTTFKVFLPARATVETGGLGGAETPAPLGHNETILLVDDEPSIREMAEAILPHHGYEVLVAEDGPSALALFRPERNRIALVVTDLAMPGMDGLALIRALRQIKPHVKIVVSTGLADDAQVGEIAALHVDGSLAKPYTTRQLLFKLNAVLHQMQDAA